MVFIPSARLAAEYYKGHVTLMYHINKGLKSMETDKVRDKLSYCPITQKMKLHMSSDTVFTMHHHSAMGSKSVVTYPPAAAAATATVSCTREYVLPRLRGTDIGVTPSGRVVLPLSETPHVSYSFRKKALT